MKTTALNREHIKLEAKMVDFAGYSMPIQYPTGILAEHNWVRENCGIFDVSHMGQVEIRGAGASDFVSKITPTNFEKCNVNQAKYTVLVNERGGIIDDLIITKFSASHFSAVINAGTKDKDIEYLRRMLPSSLQLNILSDKALIAIQGKFAEKILQKYVSTDLSQLKYMYGTKGKVLDKHEVLITRTGYTGEDGFEISIDNSVAPQLWQKLLDKKEVKPIGLGARDSLRLEMGYPLYGHDITEDTTPIEASLGWVVTKDHKKFIADNIILNQKSSGAPRKRIGLKLSDKIVAREGAEIYKENKLIGKVTSGGFSPTLNQPICMGLVSSANAAENIELNIKVRDKFYKAQTVKMPFLEAKTKK